MLEDQLRSESHNRRHPLELLAGICRERGELKIAAGLFQRLSKLAHFVPRLCQP